MENNNATAVPLWEAGLVIIVTFFISALLGAAILLTLGYGAAGVIGEIAILVVPMIYLLSKRINIKSYVGINLQPKYILLGLASGALLFLLNIAVSAALSFLPSQTVEQTNLDILNNSSTTPGFIMIAASLALAGICEEFAFRGFLQNTLNRRYSFVPALLVSALVFGVFHLDPQGTYIISAFILGLALGYIYHRTNYVTSATAHATMNLIVLAFLLLGI